MDLDKIKKQWEAYCIEYEQSQEMDIDKHTSMAAKVGYLLRKIELQQEEMKQLQKENYLLSCLEACGVDNWSGWDDAMEMFTAEEDED